MAMIEPLRASLYDLRTGTRLTRVPITTAPWTKTLNEWGTLSVKVARTPSARLQQLRQIAQPWRTLLVLTRGDRVMHSGVITSRPYAGGTLTLKAKGFGAVFGKRLVLNRALIPRLIDGVVLIDEDNPAPHWFLTLDGSLVDIASKLITETLAWGPLPVVPAALQGGSATRTYYGYDFASVEKRMLELTKVENGPELRFREELSPGSILYRLEGGDELVSTHHQWNTANDSGVILGDIDDDGDAIVTEQWMIGGRNEDMMLITRRSGALADYPLLQLADSGHSTVSEIATLRAYAREAIVRGARTQEVIDVEVPASEVVLPGDWADVRTAHPFYGDVVLPLKVVGVSGSTSTRLKVSCRIRHGETV